MKLTNDHASSGDVLDANHIHSGRLTVRSFIMDHLIRKLKILLPRTLSAFHEVEAPIAGYLAYSDHDAVSTKRQHKNKVKFNSRFQRQLARSGLLVTATILATITYQAAVSACATGTYKIARVHCHPHGHNYSTSGLDSFMMTRWFLMFNSAVFSISMAVIIFLLYEFPLKPWPQIAISTMFGSYMCLIVTGRPSDEASPLLLLSLPPFLLAAVGNVFGFASSHPKFY